MPANLVTATGFILTTITGALALYYWRRSSGLYSLLVEGANRFEEQRQRSGGLELAVARSDERMKQHRSEQQKLERAVDDAREKVAELTRRIETREHEMRAITEKLELQKGHLEKVAARAETKRAEAEQALAVMVEELRLARSEAAAQIEENKLKERDWQAQKADLERTRADAEKRGKEMDPAELKRLKRKIAQYDRLYASMKGLREMTEERNRNWEVALRKLAAHILEERGTKTQLPTEIGPLVGMAMSSIGAQLIDETAEEAGAGRAVDMDDDGPLTPTAQDLEEAT